MDSLDRYLDDHSRPEAIGTGCALVMLLFSTAVAIAMVTYWIFTIFF